MSLGDASLHADGGQWLVRLEGANGRNQTYQCATREQAERLLALFRAPVPPRRPSSSNGTSSRERPRSGSWFGTRS